MAIKLRKFVIDHLVAHELLLPGFDIFQTWISTFPLYLNHILQFLLRSYLFNLIR